MTDRELLRKVLPLIWHKHYCETQVFRDSKCNCGVGLLLASITTRLSEPAEDVVAVPREPTTEMIAAGLVAASDTGEITEVYKAMLDASQKKG